MAKILIAQDVEKSYGNIKALRGASLEVSTREIVGLVGPNGTGKTTLIKISLGLLRRDSGTVLLNGRDPFLDYRAREGVSVVFERPMLPNSIRIADLLERAARIYGSSRASVREAIKLAGLEGHELKTFEELSAGLKQRAAIAHALVAEPNFIIADEPTSNLDPLERRRILELIAELNKDKGISFLISSHIIAEVVNVANRIVALAKGKTVASGSPSEILKKASLARVRAPDPEALASALADQGFLVEQEGFSVIIRLNDYSEYPQLLEALASIARSGLTILSVDLAGVSIEEMIKAG
ncbi:MAG: ABC transporter ATP-binding protein [Acidilobaceae archaeon]